MRRYVVLGRSRDIEAWRRQRGLSRREVVPVSTMQGDTAVRGLCGDFEVVTLESWALASATVRKAVEFNLRVAGCTAAPDGGA